MTSVFRSSSLAIRLIPVALLAVFLFGLQGCKAKPSEKDCKSAINNVRRIYGQDSSDMGADPIAMIRSCRGSSSQKSVDCMIAADSEKDLESCEGDVGSQYVQKEAEATEKREKESGEGEDAKEVEAPGEDKEDAPADGEAAPAEGVEAAPAEGAEAAAAEGAPAGETKMKAEDEAAKPKTEAAPSKAATPKAEAAPSKTATPKAEAAPGKAAPAAPATP